MRPGLGAAAVPVLLLLTSAGCALPALGASSWTYNPRTSSCERLPSGSGVSEEQCARQLEAAATQQAAVAATAYARSLPTATRTTTSTPQPTNTPTPRPPTNTPTETPLPTSTRTSTPSPSATPRLTSTSTATPEATKTSSPSPTQRSGTTATIRVTPPRGPVATHFEFELAGYSEDQISEWAVIDSKGQVTKENYHLSWIAEDEAPPGMYRVTASSNGRVVAEGSFEVLHNGERAPPRLTTSPAKGKRGTAFALTFSGGPQKGTVDWITRLPDGRVNRVPMQLNASGNYLGMSYTIKTGDPLGVYRHEVVSGGKMLATTTFEVTD